MFRIYDWRQLKCRTYGLIPKTLYDWIVESVAKESGVKKDALPMCKQCDQVKIIPECIKGREGDFPDGKMTERMIRKMEMDIRDIDISLGMSPSLQAKGYGFLTYHDWHLLFELGEEFMEKLTLVRKNPNDEGKEQFLKSLADSLVTAASKENLTENS